MRFEAAILAAAIGGCAYLMVSAPVRPEPLPRQIAGAARPQSQPYDLEREAHASFDAARATLPGRWTAHAADRPQSWRVVAFGSGDRAEAEGVGTYALERGPGYFDGCVGTPFAIRVRIQGTTLEGEWDVDRKDSDLVLLRRWTGRTEDVPVNRPIRFPRQLVWGETLILKRVGTY